MPERLCALTECRKPLAPLPDGHRGLAPKYCGTTCRSRAQYLRDHPDSAEETPIVKRGPKPKEKTVTRIVASASVSHSDDISLTVSPSLIDRLWSTFTLAEKKVAVESVLAD